MHLKPLLVSCALYGCAASSLLAIDAKPSSKSGKKMNAVVATAVAVDPVDAASSSAVPVVTGPSLERYARPVITTSVAVEATGVPVSATSTRITPMMIDTAAGAYEDPARYFQLLPGVAAGSDARNDFLVRGGNPSENLFVIDNIDVHSISHLALSNTTGGFVSMIDNAAVESMTLHTSEHDAKFDDRLSSVVEISTVPDQTPGSRRPVRHMTEAGIAGVGGMDSRPLGERGSLFVSGREGILRFVTNDIGMNGVPHYNNSLVRGDSVFANGDKIWGIALTGQDSMVIRPDANDREETNPIDIHYSGWRNTTGINWQHGFSARSFGLFTLSNSEQAQTVVENGQQMGNLNIYDERTHNGDTSLKTQFTMQVAARLSLSAGATETLTRLQYDIVQPDGVATNPYDTNGSASTATNIHRNFATTQDASYVQASMVLPANFRLTVAARAQRWGLGGNFALTPKASLSVPLGRMRALTLSVADYAQMPASLYLLAFSQNEALRPIHARHLTAALTLVDGGRAKMTVAAYHKKYRDYPVATQFPQLSLANVGDSFGQAFLMLPMVSRGLGQAMGAEVSVDLKPTSRLTIMANLAYARNRFSGLDGVLRDGSSDLPLMGNLAAVGRLGHGTTLSVRYSGSSGRPYTPDDLVQSTLQNRDVYDLAQINALRAPAFARLDFRLERTARFRAGELVWHVGLDNAMNRKNFYTFAWQPNLGKVVQQTRCHSFQMAE